MFLLNFHIDFYWFSSWKQTFYWFLLISIDILPSTQAWKHTFILIPIDFHIDSLPFPSGKQTFFVPTRLSYWFLLILHWFLLIFFLLHRLESRLSIDSYWLSIPESRLSLFLLNFHIGFLLISIVSYWILIHLPWLFHIFILIFCICDNVI